MSGEQLAFQLDHAPGLTRADFLVGKGNEEALAVIDAWPVWSPSVQLLSGPPGSGKTHLVEIWRERSGATVIPAAALQPDSGEGLQLVGAAAIEDIDRAPAVDAALFHFLNRARERGVSVLITGRDAGATVSRLLPDLASRLRAARPLVLAPPDEDLLGRVLVKLFADRQLFVGPSLIAYLVRRMERSFEAAALLVRQLDETALGTGKPLSRQMAAPFLTSFASGTDFEIEDEE